MSQNKKNAVSHRYFLVATIMVFAMIVLAACGGGAAEPEPTAAPAPTEAPAEEAPAEEAPAEEEAMPAKEGLAEGMVGGPTGFEGAERYQYAADSPAGRAIAALNALPADQKPEKIVMMMLSGAAGHMEVPFPEGAKAAKDVFKEEAGIDIEIIPVSSDEMFQKIIQDTTTQSAGYDIYQMWGNQANTLAESGALLILDDYVTKYAPEWDQYYTGGQQTVQQFNTHKGNYVGISFDGDYHTWFYRSDLFEDPDEQAAFKEKYGWDLQWPDTWEQLDQVSEFFHRPDEGLYGVTDLRNPGWGWTNWYQRYASSADPSMKLFDADTAKPLIDGPEGIAAAEAYANTLQWHSPDAKTWGWPEQYANMTAGGAAVTAAFPNMSKALDNPDNPDSQVVGKLKSGLPPGHIVDGKLIRRSLWWPNVTFGVSPQSEYPEATYLFLQWANSPSIFTWMVGNPAGYFDPFQVSDWEDPLVVANYKDWHVPTLVGAIERAMPPILLNGTQEYETALDTELQAVLAGTKTAEQAMADAAAEWEKITDRLGREAQIKTLQGLEAGYPTITDTPTIEN